jgi:hypothetical protein
VAKYVLLQFDNDDQADKFIESVDKDEVYRDTSGWLEDAERVHSFFVRGVYKKPTKFCECTGNMKNRAFTRGTKYGWWVCTKCGKPTPAWARGDHWFLALGRNLLPVDDRAGEYRGDGVYGRYRKECPDCHSSCLATQGHGTCTVWCPKCEKYV